MLRQQKAYCGCSKTDQIYRRRKVTGGGDSEYIGEVESLLAANMVNITGGGPG